MAELVSENFPVPVIRVGINDTFGSPGLRSFIKNTALQLKTWYWQERRLYRKKGDIKNQPTADYYCKSKSTKIVSPVVG